MMNDTAIAQMLRQVRSIAVVGLSSRKDRPSYGVSAYMQAHGYKIIPVNPTETEVLGEKARASLKEVPGPIELVNVFRMPSAVPEIVDQAIALGIRYLWLQEGVVHPQAAERAQHAGIQVVMDRCILKEHRRLIR